MGGNTSARKKFRAPQVGALVLVLQLSGFLLIGYSSPPRSASPHNLTTRVEEWRQDLRFLATELPRRHINAFHQVTPAQFQSAVNELDAAIPSLPDHVIIARLTAIVAMVGDAHTSLSWTSGASPFRRYPLTLRVFNNAAYVTGVTSATHDTGRGRASYARALGSRLVRVGEVEVEQAGRAVAALISAENEAWVKASIPSFLITPEILNALGLMPEMERGQFTFEDAAGRQFEMEFTPVARTAPINPLLAPYLARVPTPLYRSRPSSQFYWYEYLESAKTVYFQYNRCQEMAALPFSSFSQGLLSFIDTHAVERLVIDLRQNSGGNSAILLPFITAIRSRPVLNRRGRLFVAIDNGTFSSGMLNTVNLQQQTQAILVGEPTGGKPNSYGEVQGFNLPNSGLAVFYSTKFFNTVPGDLPSVMPDLPVELSAADYLAGKDPVLEAILAY